MKIRILTTLIICLFTLNTFSQTEAITIKGDTIIVFDNGTWKNKAVVKKTSLIESSVNATVTIDDFSNKKQLQRIIGILLVCPVQSLDYQAI